jgi:TP901 family phage tail tape measure protein
MTDVAALSYRIDSSDALTAEKNLGRMDAAASRSERKVKGLGAAASKSFGGAASAAKKMAGMVAVATAAIGSAATVVAALNRAAQRAGEFGTAMAEVSTLIEGTPAQMKALREESIRLSSTFGGTATKNTKAFYQAISAGAASMEDAAKIVEQANKLAVGGLTDVFTATDGLTSVMNAYAESGLTAAAASDSMFVAMRAGKTTIGELSSTLGRIAPFASAAGVSFDELTAAIAAVTSKGISTNEAVTGLRQALVAITKPSAQATELAGELSVEFNAAALEAKGLEGFMRSLAEATGGSVAQLTELLGSAEAANAVLALLAGDGAKFSEVLEQQAEKIGATDEAVAKMAETLENRMARAMAVIENAGLGPGQVWLKLKVQFAEAVAGIIGDVQNMADVAKKIFSGDWKGAWKSAGGTVDIATAGMNVAMAGVIDNMRELFSRENLNKLGSAWSEFWSGITGNGNSETELARMAPDFDIVRDEYFRLMEDMRVATNEMYANWDEASKAAGAVTEEELVGSVEKAKIEFVQIGEIAGGDAWGGIKKAADAAEELAENLDSAATSSAKIGSNGGARGGFEMGRSSSGARRTVIYTDRIIQDRLDNGLIGLQTKMNQSIYEGIISGAEKGFTKIKGMDLGEDIVTMSVAPGVTDDFWADFEFKATNSWTDALSAAFEAGGDSLLRITDEMVGSLRRGTDALYVQMTKSMFHVNTRYQMLDSFINRSISRQLESADYNRP